MELRVKNKRVRFFNNLSITFQFDSVADTFGFQMYFNPENPEHRVLAEIGSFNECQIFEENELLLTGTILSCNFESSKERNLLTLEGYSKSGVLMDCTIPNSLYPLQTDGLSVANIAKRIIEPFGISLVDKVGANEPIPESTANEKQSIASYLGELTSQRNIVLSSDENGNIVFTKANVSAAPIITYSPQERNGIEQMSLSFDGQGSNSTITVMKEASDDPSDEPGQSEISNPLVKSGFRPTVKVQTTGNEFDTSKATKVALATQLQKLKVTVQLSTWKVGGRIIKPNEIIEIENPEIGIYKKTKFFIQAVNLARSPKGDSATLDCVLLQVYGGIAQNV